MQSNKITCGIFCLALMISSLGFGQSSHNSILEKYIQEALTKNPELVSSRKNVEAVRTQVPQVSTLPDPMLKLGAMNLPANSFVFNQEPMTGKQVMLTQRFPFFGTLRLKSLEKKQAVKIARARLNAKENEIIRKVKEAFYNIIYFNTAVSIAQQNQEIINQFAQVASQKYETGKGLQQDVLRAQVAHSRITEKLIVLQKEKHKSRVELNTLLYRSIDDPLKKITGPPIVFHSIDQDTLYALAAQHSPRLLMKKAREDQQRLQKRLSRRNYFPHLDISVAYTQRENIMGGTMHDFFSAQLGFSLPFWFWRKQSKNVQEAEFRIDESRWDYINTKKKIEMDITDFTLLLDEKEKRLHLYEVGILLLGRQSLDAALTAYTVNKVDFLTLLSNQEQLLDDEMAHARLIADYQITKAKLEETVGKRIY